MAAGDRAGIATHGNALKPGFSKLFSQFGAPAQVRRWVDAACRRCAGTPVPVVSAAARRRAATALAQFGGAQRVGEQRRDGHRADASGNRGDPRRALLHRVEVDVADELAVGAPVDADVDHDGAGLDPVALDELRRGPRRPRRCRPAGRVPGRSRVAEWQIVTVQRAISSSSAIGRPTMFDWPMTTACLPTRSSPVSASSVMHPYGVHGPQRRPLQHQAADVVRVEAVDVLAGIDALGDALLVDVLRAAAAGPGCRARRGRRSACRSAPADRPPVSRREVVRERAHAGRFGRAPLVADVDLRGGVLADQHDGESRLRASARRRGPRRRRRRRR